LTGFNVIILADHDTAGNEYAEDTAKALAGVAASIRIVPYQHLWEHLDPSTRGTEPRAGEDIANWLDPSDRGGDAAKLLEICQKISAEGDKLDVWDAGETLDGITEEPRQWLMFGEFCRGFLSGLVAPGDTCKTTLRLTQAIELATGRELLGFRLYGRRKVLIICFEDDTKELRRRLRAICIHHHKIAPAELKGWLFCSNLKGDGPKIAELDAKGRKRMVGQLDRLLRDNIKEHTIDLIILDPFFKLHALNENDNPDMDFVCSALIKIAQECNVGTDCPSHTHKGAIAVGDADARRGGSAQRDAMRLDKTLTAMTEGEAKHRSRRRCRD
jgi:RecA-family ATPase